MTFEEVYNEINERLESIISDVNDLCDGDDLLETGVYEMMMDRIEVALDSIDLRD